LYAIAFGTIYRFKTAVWVAGGILVGVIFFFALAASPLAQHAPEPWRTLALNLLEATKKMCRGGRSFLWILAITASNWFLSFFQVWLCYRAFNTEVPLTYVFAALPMAIFTGLLPVTLSGMGTRDSAVIYLFQNYAAYEVNLAIGILYAIFGYWLLALLGVPFMRAAFRGAIGGVEAEELHRQVYR